MPKKKNSETELSPGLGRKTIPLLSLNDAKSLLQIPKDGPMPGSANEMTNKQLEILGIKEICEAIGTLERACKAQGVPYAILVQPFEKATIGSADTNHFATLPDLAIVCQLMKSSVMDQGPIELLKSVAQAVDEYVQRVKLYEAKKEDALLNSN